MPVVLGAFFCVNPWPLALLTILALTICQLELNKLIKREWPISVPLLVILYFGVTRLPGQQTLPFQVLSALMGVGGLLIGCLAARASSRGSKSILAEVLAPLWFVAPIWSIFQLHALVSGSHLWNFANPMLLAVVPLWGGDTAAIFVGKAFGKHPLAPTISPKKTIEGSIGNLLACLLVAVPLGIWIGYPWWVGALCGGIAGVFGQMGDLFESFIKRQAGVKDSGSILPGHGGLLDRIDSVLFTAPLVLSILLFVSPDHIR